MFGIIFPLRMLIKEYSLSRKVGWEEYKAKTWFLIPKLYNNAALSYFIYTLFIVSSVYTYYNGGIEKTAKELIPR